MPVDRACVGKGSSKLKVSLWFVISGVIIKAEPSFSNKSETSDGSVVLVCILKTI